MKTLKSKYEIVLDRLKKDGKVSLIDENQKDQLIDKVTREIEDYRFSNQKRIRESQMEISTVILTA